MRFLSVKAEHDYEVHISQTFNSLTTLIPENALWVTTEKLIEILPIEFPRDRTLVVPDGENQKRFSQLHFLLDQFAARGLSRSSLVVGVGGGATTDLVGFAAAIYMRGINWIAVPTSLAGMVDAAVGGKTGINLDSGKNLVGSFHSPKTVLVATGFLSSLPERDLKAGLAEVIKCGFIADPKILHLVQEDFQSSIEELVFRSIAVKANVVSNDFKENGEREILNYGHTLGHAVEAHSGYSLRHGEAVAIGLLFAAEVSHRFGTLDSSSRDLHRNLLSSIGLPLSYRADAWPELFELMLKDKKRRGEGIRFVTLDAIGKPSRIDSLSEESLAALYARMIAR
jgi:3-dehydroquinate synthase